MSLSKMAGSSISKRSMELDRARKYAKTYNLQKKYKMSLADRDRLERYQAGRCAICGVDATSVKRGLHIDHSHKTGRVRGLLCVGCNTGLGAFRDNRWLLQAAINYLARHERANSAEPSP
jgi:Recombination endonuclease VII